jgi:rhodanese-related sulfurtransferase
MSKTPKEMVEEAKARITEVHVDDVHRQLPEQPIIIDVREPGEYLAGHLPGAVNIPRGVLEFQIAGYLQERDQTGPIILYCRSGGRSALATDALQQLGYEDVRNMAGGFHAWKTAGLPVTET